MNRENLPTVALAITTFNMLDYTKKFWQSLIDNTEYPYNVLWWDNGSTDGTIEYIQQLKVAYGDKFEYIISSKNVGCVGSRDYQLINTDTDFVVFLDNDILLPPRWLSKLMDVMEKDDKIGICGGVCSKHDNYLELNSDEIQLESIPFVRGACCCIRREVIDELGGYSRAYQIYGHADDNYYARKASAAGWKIINVLNVHIWHNNNTTISQIKNWRDISQSNCDMPRDEINKAWWARSNYIKVKPEIA